MPIHLPKAPITEALLDIRVRLPEGVSYQALEPFVEVVSGSYPTKRFRKELHAEIKADESGNLSQSGDQKTVGYQLTSGDGLRVVQVRENGFSFSRLAPYTTWDELRDEASALWIEYSRVAQPEMVSRIALRYINRINLPLPLESFEKYLRTAPSIAPGLPQTLAHFFLRLAIPIEEGTTAIINQTIQPLGPDATHLPLILDIDVAHLQAYQPADPRVWERFKKLRELKNRVFFESITPDTVELCQ